jgi:hypothetical protein
MRTCRWRRDTAIVALLAAHLCSTSCNKVPAPAIQHQKPATSSCELLIYNHEDTELILRIKQKDMMKNLIYDPISKAKENPHPAAYVVLGLLILRKDDGTKEEVQLFRPWGHIKIGETYFTCELDGLRMFLADTLERARVRTE